MTFKRFQLHAEIFAEVSYHSSYEPMRAIRTDRWKYVRRFESYDEPVLPNIDDGLSKTVWHEAGWLDQPQAMEFVIDLTFDRHKSNNLASDPRHAATRDDLRNRLDRWMRETADPLLAGPVAAPANGRVTRVDAYSSSE